MSLKFVTTLSIEYVTQDFLNEVYVSYVVDVTKLKSQVNSTATNYAMHYISNQHAS